MNFFMNRFTGMTRRVAEVLTTRVFNILEDSEDDSSRFTASAFGAWIKDLPDLLTDQPIAPPRSHQRTVSVTSITHGFPISTSTPLSHRPSSRQVSRSNTIRTPLIPSRSLSRAPSFGAPYEQYESAELSTVIDQEIEELDDKPEQEDEDLTPAGMTSRSTSTNKRRKRGARKNKGASSTPGSIKGDVDDTLNTLAVASQSLARELSRTSKVSSLTKPASIKSSSTKASSNDSRKSKQPYEPVSMYGFPAPLCAKENGSSTRTISSGASTGSLRSSIAPSSLRSSTVAPAPPSSPARAPVAKKPSKWKLSFGKAHSSPLAEDVSSTIVQPADNGSNPPHMSQTVSQVSSLIMGLNASPPPPASAQNHSSADDASSWRRGRRGRSPPRSSVKGGRPPLPSYVQPDQASERAASPQSNRSGRPLASSASSVASSNWRSSMSTASSAGTSSSAFTRYSNSSTRSVSTAATSVSSASWRTNGKHLGGPSSDHSHHSVNSVTHSGPPKNVKSTFLTC